MTILEALDRVEHERSPGGDTGYLIGVINNLEWRIKREIIDAAEDGEDYPFEGYTADDLGETLLAPEPYDEVYVAACKYKLDMRENQLDNAANSLEIFNTLYDRLSRYWIRAHMPKQGAALHSSVYGV